MTLRCLIQCMCMCNYSGLYFCVLFGFALYLKGLFCLHKFNKSFFTFVRYGVCVIGLVYMYS